MALVDPLENFLRENAATLATAGGIAHLRNQGKMTRELKKQREALQ